MPELLCPMIYLQRKSLVGCLISLYVSQVSLPLCAESQHAFRLMLQMNGNLSEKLFLGMDQYHTTERLT